MDSDLGLFLVFSVLIPEDSQSYCWDENKPVSDRIYDGSSGSDNSSNSHWWLLMLSELSLAYKLNISNFVSGRH